MSILSRASRSARWGAVVGLGCGVVYAFGGLVVDLLTVGLNGGTALAFLALLGMPLLFGAVAFVLGALTGLLVAIIRGRTSHTP